MTANLRPMTGDTAWTCDWGGCDDPTVAERHASNLDEWLAVCRRHTGRTADRRQSPGRAQCPGCGGDYQLSVQGRMRAHNRGFAERCPGSGRLPGDAVGEVPR